MPLSDFWMLEQFTVRHPPADLLVASYLGYKREGKQNTRQAARENASALSAIPPKMLQMKSIDQMPSFVRSPEMLKVMEGVKAEWRANG
jgi:hypothetical protein